MAGLDNEKILNRVLIQLSRSFLQYVAESSPWVRFDAPGLATQVEAIAARQRQDVSEIVALLTDREWFVDFGTFPTEYTDQQFLGLDVLIGRLRTSQSRICATIAAGADQLQASGDSAGRELLDRILLLEQDLEKSLAEIERDVRQPA